MKSKTIATWLTFVLGPFGIHRFYLKGMQDTLGWFMPIPTALGVWGFERIQAYGLDDTLSWVLLPIFGIHIAACSLQAIVYGLSTPEKWNAQFNPEADPKDLAGKSSWFTVFGIIISLLVGTAALMSAIAYGTQRYFETQLDAQEKLATQKSTTSFVSVTHLYV
jgi:TM2 domain-containing membrane protein YozV